VAEARASWLVNVVLYSVAGAASSLAVGYIIGTLGTQLLPPQAVAASIPILLTAVPLLAARELGWVRFPLPQLHRQTKDLWAKSFKPATAATLWGLDLGLAVTTRFSFSGPWALVLLAVLTADPVLGAGALLGYWSGRAATVWVAPLMMEDAASAPGLLDAFASKYRLVQVIHLLGLGLLIAFLVISSAGSVS
jgi:hypothetical protein